MGGLMWWHWVLIIAAFILIFGARKLPDAARGVGRSLRILKSEVSAMHDDDDKGNKPPAETDATATVPTPPSQIAAAPVPTSPQAPSAPPAAPAAQTPAPPQQAQVPVINGVPADQQRT